MKKALLVVGLIIVGVVIYYRGWGNGVMYMATSNVLARGQANLLIAKTLRKGDVKEALKWTDFELQRTADGLKELENRVPKQFAESYSRISPDVKAYQDQYGKPSK